MASIQTEPPPYEDEMLWMAARDGDGAAFTELFRRHQGLAWRVARAATLDDDRAAVAVVEGVLGCVGTRRPQEVPFRGRLVAAIREAALRQVRSRARPTDGPVLPTDPVPADPRGSDVGEGELCLQLATSATPPPPELWAVVQVAWQDFIRSTA